MRVFYTAPTLLRSLMQAGDEWVTKHDRSSLRVLGTVGEPIGQNAWNWFGASFSENPHVYTSSNSKKFCPSFAPVNMTATYYDI